MEEDLRTFPDQLRWTPEIVNEKALRPVQQVVVVGMGGSHLSADVYRMLRRRVHMHVHTSYGLPHVSDELKEQTLVVLSSYSGNTTEVLDAYRNARKEKFLLAAVTSGGVLGNQAAEDGIPHIILPAATQPRISIGYGVVALSHLLRDTDLITALSDTAPLLSGTYKEEASSYASWFEDTIPLIYAAHADFPLAYIWKIAFNETAKIPAFANEFPELNHNEIEGFDVEPDKSTYQKRFRGLFLLPTEEDERIEERMQKTAEIYKRRGVETRMFERAGKTRIERVFKNILMAQWVAYELAILRGIDPEATPLIERFKKRLTH